MLKSYQVLCLLIAMAITLPCSSQKLPRKHPSLLGVHYTLNEYEKGILRNAEGGISINFVKGINNYFDYSVGLQGSFTSKAFKNISSDSKHLLLQADFSIRSRLLNGSHLFQPYIQTGLGGGISNIKAGAYFLAGPGVQMNYRDIYFLFNGQYRLSLTPKQNNHLFLSIGIAGIINRPKAKTKKDNNQSMQPRVILDSDKDGIIDSLDVCPLQPGLAVFDGCPDSDGDGIQDKTDKCPTIFGCERYNGCPIPDTDKDGINNELDSCIAIPGIERYNGCPIPDSDGDGLNDEVDNCINEPGLKENFGCPANLNKLNVQLDSIAQNIFFSTGSARLLPKSFSALNKVATLLKENLQLKLSIEGHTDNHGSSTSNQVLSEQRAQEVASYLISEGISHVRLNAVGFGQTKPTTENLTEKGRAKNRRVELKLIQN